MSTSVDKELQFIDGTSDITAFEYDTECNWKISFNAHE
jgi:hypothetical protein